MPASNIPGTVLLFAGPQARAAGAVINAGLSAYNHTMGRVLSKMDAAGIK